MVDVKVVSGSKLGVKGLANDEPVHLVVDQPVTLHTLDIGSVNHIAPLATHIKEVNHIDPLTIEPLQISGVDNISPLRVEQFEVTHLPAVQLHVRQLPTIDVGLRRLPPVSLGLSQDYVLESGYELRGRLLGFEVFRVGVQGNSTLKPRDHFRREQRSTHNQSFPSVALAGNPAIPSHHTESITTLRVAACPAPEPCAAAAAREQTAGHTRSGSHAAGSGLGSSRCAGLGSSRLGRSQASVPYAGPPQVDARSGGASWGGSSAGSANAANPRAGSLRPGVGASLGAGSLGAGSLGRKGR